MRLTWTSEAWGDYLCWQTQDKKTLKRVNSLINDALRHPFEGTGKPEPLKGPLSGCWSRRIDQSNRLIYSASEHELTVMSAKDHY